MNAPLPAAPPRSRGGFTLIQLLTLIAIIGSLAAILIPMVGRGRESARGGEPFDSISFRHNDPANFVMAGGAVYSESEAPGERFRFYGD